MRTEGFGRRLVQGAKNQLSFGARALVDPVFYLLASTSLCGWFLGRPNIALPLGWLLVKAFYEEFFFRFMLQEALWRVLPKRWRLGPFTAANLIVSLGFATMHLWRQDPMWAAMTFIPSLLFGYAWDRYKSLLPVWCVHFLSNFFLFHKGFG